MKETNLAQTPFESDRETVLVPHSPDVRLLDDLELGLVGGGDGVIEWP